MVLLWLHSEAPFPGPDGPSVFLCTRGTTDDVTGEASHGVCEPVSGHGAEQPEAERSERAVLV